MTMMTLLTQSDLAQADERIQSGAKDSADSHHTRSNYAILNLK